jgi:hypothetical protein
VSIGFAATALVYGLALWLRAVPHRARPAPPRLLLTGSGLLAYALAHRV